MTYRIEYDLIPPSMNHGGGRGKHWSTVRSIKSEWEGIFAVLLLKAKVPKHLGSVQVYVALQFKDRRKRDIDNYFFSVSKPLGDAMKKGGWIEDDDPEHYRMEMTMTKGAPKTRMVITITTSEA